MNCQITIYHHTHPLPPPSHQLFHHPSLLLKQLCYIFFPPSKQTQMSPPHHLQHPHPLPLLFFLLFSLFFSLLFPLFSLFFFIHFFKSGGGRRKRGGGKRGKRESSRPGTKGGGGDGGVSKVHKYVFYLCFVGCVCGGC